MQTKTIRSVICFIALLIALGCNRKTGNNQDFGYADWRDVHIDSLEKLLATKSLTDKELMSIHENLSMGYLNTNYEKSIFHARQGILYAGKVNNPFKKGVLYNHIGVAYSEISKDDSAMIYFNKALEQLPLIDKKKVVNIDGLKADVYGALANLYNAQDNYHEALKYYLMMLELLEKRHGKNNTMILYHNVGDIYFRMDNFEEAEKYFMKMKALALELNDKNWIAGSYWEASRIALSLHKDYSKALENAKTALEMMETDSTSDKFGEIDPLLTLSSTYLEGYHDYAKAEKYASLAQKLAEKQGEPGNISDVLVQFAEIYLQKGMYRESKRAALKAQKIDSARNESNTPLFNLLAKCSAFLGKPAQAAEYFDRYAGLVSKQSNKNYMVALTEMQVKYDTQKNELEIERQKQTIARQNIQRGLLVGGVAASLLILVLLWYLLRLRTRRNRTLAEMNATKDKFFSIISHDLKNPALAQRDALQLLIKNARSWDVDTLTGYYHELLKSAEEQVELLYNLLNWAQVQTGRMAYIPVTFNLPVHLRADISLIRKMAESKGITFVAEMPEDAFVTGDSNMLVTVIRNLLTNAVKFTENGGTVSLNISPAPSNSPEGGENPLLWREAGEAYTISVSDTGTGMSEEQIRNLFQLDSRHTRRGTAGEPSGGLGLIVCKELLEKHGSLLKVESEEGKGSRFEFTIAS